MRPGTKCGYGRILSAICCSSFLVVFAQTAAFGQAAASDVQDIALLKGEYLVGLVKQDAKTAATGQRVELVNFKGERSEAKTDEQGRFVFKGLSGGSHMLVIGDKAFPVRMWSEGIAPRSAKQYFSYTATPAVRTVQYTTPAAQPPAMIVRGQAPYCDNCQGACDGGCDGVGGGHKGPFGGAFAGITPAGAVVGATAVGLGVWGIVELADDDDSAS